MRKFLSDLMALIRCEVLNRHYQPSTTGKGHSHESGFCPACGKIVYRSSFNPNWHSVYND